LNLEIQKKKKNNLVNFKIKMSYDKKHIPILDPEEWYNKAYKEYAKYHKFLENFDKNLWQRFLPRDLKHKIVVDLGCGDGRLANFFLSKWVKEYVCLDISENMLKQAKNSVKKIKHDLNKPFPLSDSYADVVLALFVLLHIENLHNFFSEVYRILKDDGVFILFHHIERKNHIYWKWWNKFKINAFKWHYSDIEKLLDYYFFKYKVVDVEENWVIIWKYFICKK